MGLMEKTCHYCPAQADTRDHIVPRVLVRAIHLRGNHWFFPMNVVPSCFDCNQEKGEKPSDCDCEQCVTAWHYYRILELYPDEPVPVFWSSIDTRRPSEPLSSTISDLVDPAALLRLLGDAPET